jgi:NADPH-dependent glutamate synthase beta subunit-like oxidoreductase
MMGRVCPAPCQDGCNRNDVEDFVGINAVEQYIGDSAIANGYKFTPGADIAKKVAVIGGGPAGMAAAYQLRRMGYGVAIFDENAELGGMMRYGIPGYRIPRDKLDAELNRIVEMGVDLRLKTRVGRDVSVADVEPAGPRLGRHLQLCYRCRLPQGLQRGPHEGHGRQGGLCWRR